MAPTSKTRKNYMPAEKRDKKRQRSTAGRLDEGQLNPPRGERSGFLKLTITLPPELYKRLADEAAYRKMAKQPNPVISAIVREAVQAYLDTATPRQRS